MSELCPVCETGTAYKIKRLERFKWKNKFFTIEYNVWVCIRCNSSYIDASADDPFSQAKAKYEELYGKEKDVKEPIPDDCA